MFLPSGIIQKAQVTYLKPICSRQSCKLRVRLQGTDHKHSRNSERGEEGVKGDKGWMLD